METFITPKDLLLKSSKRKFSAQDIKSLENFLLEKVNTNIFSIFCSEWERKSNVDFSQVFLFLKEQGYEVEFKQDHIEIDMRFVQHEKSNSTSKNSALSYTRSNSMTFNEKREAGIDCKCYFDELGPTSSCSACGSDGINAGPY